MFVKIKDQHLKERNCQNCFQCRVIPGSKDKKGYSQMGCGEYIWLDGEMQERTYLYRAGYWSSPKGLAKHAETCDLYDYMGDGS